MSDRAYLPLGAAVVVFGSLFTVQNVMTAGVDLSDFLTAALSIAALGVLARARVHYPGRERRRRHA